MIGGQRTGPLSRVELGLQVEAGTVTGDSHVWKKGMSGWVPGGGVAELAALFSDEPPPPPPEAVAAPKAARPAKPAPPAKRPARPAGRAAAAAEPEDHGKGMRDLDTSHFRLADLPPKDDGTKNGVSEFDTGFFKVQEQKSGGKNIDDALSKLAEFDTSHFRLSDLKRVKPPEAPLALDLDEKEHKPGVVGYPTPGKPAAPVAAPLVKKISPLPAPKATPAARLKPVAVAEPPPAPAPPKPAKPEKPWDPNSTAVEYLPLGEQVHQDKLAGELFEGADEPAPAAPTLAPPKPAPAPEKRSQLIMNVKPPSSDVVAQIAAKKQKLIQQQQQRRRIMMAGVGGGALAAIVALWMLFR